MQGIPEMAIPERDFSLAIKNAGLSMTAGESLARIMVDQNLLDYNGTRLLWFLSSLSTGNFNSLTAVQKLEDLEIFLRLITNGDEVSMRQICSLIFEGKAPAASNRHFLPERMTTALINCLRSEKDIKIKEMIWSILQKREIYLRELVSPYDIISVLWQDNPLFRDRIILFLLKNYDHNEIMRAVVSHASKTAEALPPPVLQRFIVLATGEQELRKKKHILTDLSNNNILKDEDIDHIWSEYISKANRFQLIRLNLSGSSFSWAEDLKKNRQLKLAFAENPETPFIYSSLNNRMNLIRKNW